MGAEPLADGSTRFRVWAPKCERVEVEIVGDPPLRLPMQRVDHGIYELRVDRAGAGTDYWFVLDGDKRRPDPCSRWQPDGVHGPSRVVAQDAFVWSDTSFRGVPARDLVIYELHVGTFTPEGTFDAIIPKLRYLADLGITAIEIMPVAQFPGSRNWGYDGVGLYAPQSTYGGPEGLKRLIDAAHQLGLAVVLDVVYNHLGPEGNYLGDFGPYFTGRYSTPWGQALNFDGPGSDEVRRYFRDNALYWLVDYHIDGLRLDAIHAILDMSARHLLQEIVAAFHERARALGRPAFIVAESDLNDARVIQTPEKNGFDFDAQWNDDLHHALVALVSGTRQGYFADFGSVADLAKALTHGYVYDGQHSKFRQRRHGNSSLAEPGHKFVVFTQNHDQIANAWHTKRLSTIVPPAREHLAAAILFAHPGLPMLFMGQEYGEVAPFDFFTSHTDPDLAEAVRRGRREEHRSMGLSDPADPQSEATFAACKLDWASLETPKHREWLTLYRDLIALRKAHPALSNGRKDLMVVSFGEAPRWLAIERRDEGGDGVMVLANFDDEPRQVPFGASPGKWQLALSTNDPRYGGSSNGETPPAWLEVTGAGAQSGQGLESRRAISCPASTALVYTKSVASP